MFGLLKEPDKEVVVELGCVPFAVVADTRVDALKRPVHSFGASFDEGDFTLESSSSGADAFPPSQIDATDTDSSAKGGAMTASPEFRSVLVDPVDMREIVFGTTGTIGIAATCLVGGLVCADGAAADGSIDVCWSDEGVVGVVETACSDGGWVVEGVSGRAAASGSVSVVSEAPWELGVIGILGSSTASADACGTFRPLRLLGILAGQGRSGRDNHGSCA